MAQFDIYRLHGNVLVIGCQSDVLGSLSTRFVVPLVSTSEPSSRLKPKFSIDGKAWTMVTPLARAIDVRDIEGVVASLVFAEYEIKTALDGLISGY